jgi:hypothetical protein
MKRRQNHETPRVLGLQLSSSARPVSLRTRVPDDHALMRLILLVAGAGAGERKMTYLAACGAGTTRPIHSRLPERNPALARCRSAPGSRVETGRGTRTRPKSGKNRRPGQQRKCRGCHVTKTAPRGKPLWRRHQPLRLPYHTGASLFACSRSWSGPIRHSSSGQTCRRQGAAPVRFAGVKAFVISDRACGRVPADLRLDEIPAITSTPRN